MHMKKQRKFLLVVVLIFSLLVMHSGNHLVIAGGFNSASDLISDSDLGALSNHTFTLNLSTGIGASAWLRVNFNNNFNGVVDGDVVCPSGGTASTTDNGAVTIVDCTGVALPAGSNLTLTAATTNPSIADSYAIDIQTLATTTKAEIDSAQVRVYILNDVDVTATVQATLTFTVNATTSGAIINGETTNINTSSTTIAFGNILSGTKYTAGQTLEVSTNASDGFAVTVEQTQNLQTQSGSDIDPLWGATSTATAWAAPTSPDLNEERTWGHIGITGTDISGVGANQYRSLDSVSVNSPVESLTVMSHNNPADGATEGIGRVHVAYSVQISDVQEAGDYSTTLTYICTPTY